MSRPLSLALLTLPLLALAAPALAVERLPGPQVVELKELPCKVAKDEVQLEVLRAPPVGLEDEEREKTRDGGPPPGWESRKAPPWSLFDGVIDDAACRSAQLSEDGRAALALCTGLDRANPGAEHVVIRQGAAIYRHPLPVVGSASLRNDGARFAAVFEEGGGTSLHVVSVPSGASRRVTGGWRAPAHPRLAADAPTVAFEAQVGGRPAVVVARLDEPEAVMAWREGDRAEVLGIDEDGRRLLVLARPIDLLQLFVVDTIRGLRFDVSGRKGDVRHADFHGSGEAVVFSSKVGGVCGVFWADLGGRRLTELRGSVDHCFDRVRLEGGRRLVMIEEQEGDGEKRTQLYDRKRRGIRLALAPGCGEMEFSGDGRYYVSSCARSGSLRGLLLQLVPEETRSR